jgi:hypothetical protein
MTEHSAQEGSSLSGTPISDERGSKLYSAKAADVIPARRWTITAKSAKIAFAALRALARELRPREWRRRYLVYLSLIHSRLFDRKAERLLFVKTPAVDAGLLEELDGSGEKFFVYRGPIHRKVLGWAFAALPHDLKRYAFADFDAGNGRTLLLAARCHFEYAAAYTSGGADADGLEMNIAQYPRSYMSCRDLRVIHAGGPRIGVPREPAIMFFPDSLPAERIELILSEARARQNGYLGPVYLIFENAGREAGLDGIRYFEKVPLPIMERTKVFFFSPAPVAVYRLAGPGPGN